MEYKNITTAQKLIINDETYAIISSDEFSYIISILKNNETVEKINTPFVNSVVKLKTTGDHLLLSNKAELIEKEYYNELLFLGLNSEEIESFLIETPKSTTENIKQVISNPYIIENIEDSNLINKQHNSVKTDHKLSTKNKLQILAGITLFGIGLTAGIYNLIKSKTK